ncbi:MAG: ferrochelatase [Chitinophagaceae bacterium]|nr:ferrochelatase [Chitinophagaceae bacterium]MCW5926145.1 ferrochelatase [Chitinophagaceae bacterium]
MNGTQPKRGIILMNLGSPDSTEHKDVRRYLMEFLMDERVIDKPYLSRLFLVGGIIVPFRTAKSAEAYKTIWTEKGSPLIVLTRELQEALQPKIEEPVEIAMRYGNPSVKAAYDSLLQKHPDIKEVIAVPLYPHYAMSSYETAVEHAKSVYKKGRYPFTLKFIKPFFSAPDYIHSLAESIKPFLQQDYDHILFSYHGIPARHLHRDNKNLLAKCITTANYADSDVAAHKNCYRYECFETTKLVMKQLQVPDDKFSISFQSRLGKGWLEPFTDIRLEQMPGEGIKKLLILCPAFVSDCLETLEEIEERGRESFIGAGGESYTFIPCLNTSPQWVSALAGWINEYNAGSSRMILRD